MPNLQALTRQETERVHQAAGYAYGRMDERDGAFQTPGATAIAYDFSVYVHDVDPCSSIPDAWARYVATLAELARVARHAAFNPGVPL